MKNIVLSAVAVLAMSSFAVAGGDIAPVEEPIVVPEPVITDSGFYLGLAYSWLNVNVNKSVNIDSDNNGRLDFSQDVLDSDLSDIMVQAGYKFNSYVAIEGRYWFGLDSTTDWYFGDNFNPIIDTGIDAFGIYVKPMYPVTDAFDIYALLGYGAAEITASGTVNGTNWDYTSDTADGFSWGLGAAYSFTDSLAVFVDYVSIYDNALTVDDFYIDGSVSAERDTTISTVNFGLTYQF